MSHGFLLLWSFWDFGWQPKRAEEAAGGRGSVGKEVGSGFEPGLPLSSCVALDRQLNYSEPQSPHT